MPRVGFEPTIAAGQRPYNYALDRAATGTGRNNIISRHNTIACNVHGSVIVTNTLESGLRSSLRVTVESRTQGLPTVIRLKDAKTHQKTPNVNRSGMALRFPVYDRNSAKVKKKLPT